MDIFFILPVIVFVVGGIVAVVLDVQKKNKRTKELDGWCAERGWTFIPKWQEMAKAFKGGPFNKGTSRKADLGIAGVYNGLPVEGFRYQYTVSNGKSSTTYQHFVATVRVPGATWPMLQIHRGILFNEWGLSFESERFNKTFKVKCRDQEFASNFITPRVMEFLLAAPSNFTWLWTEGDRLLLASDDKYPSFETVDAWFGLLTTVLRLQDPFVFANAGTSRPEITTGGPA